MADLDKDLPQASEGKAINGKHKTNAPAETRPYAANQSKDGAGRNIYRGQGQATPRQESPRRGDKGIHNWPEYSPRPAVSGFDNSDKNKARQSIGSCTDRVAEERRVFGPWLAPDLDRQKRLVERLAPHKPPADPDPRFDHWVNHFQYYWNIGVDVKSPRAVSGKSQGRHSARSEGYFQNGSDSPRNGRYVTQYHRLLRRPQTTYGHGRLDSTDSEGNTMSSSSSAGGSNQSQPLRETQSANPRGYSRAGWSTASGDRVVAGLDRRYMGLQSVNREQMDNLVNRLTRLTSAYNAKFAPNPHVWTDTSPGAHMVMKRENTIA